MPLLFIVEVLNLEDVFPVFFDGIGISTHCKKVMATNLFLLPIAPRISLVVLVLYTSLALVGERLLGMLAIRYVKKKSVSEFILSRVLLFFVCRPLPFGTF